MIVVRPIGGLCNRLRTIESAYKLAISAGVQLKVIWDIDRHSLHAPFLKLFEPIVGVTIEENYIDTKVRNILFQLKRLWIIATTGTFIKQSFLYKTLDDKWSRETLIQYFKKHAKSGSMFVESCWDFYPIERDYTLFKPVHSIQNEINTVSSVFPSKIIGIHIRRTDHAIAINGSPLELFEQKIEELISKDNSYKFFLATDDLDVQKRLLSAYPDSMLIYSNNKSRSSDEGVLQAVIDLYLLSKTKKIIGSYWSTFSLAASEIGHIELEIMFNA